MDAQKTISILNDILRLRICLILGNSSLSLAGVKELYEKIYKDIKNRETIYRALDVLVENGLVDKKYNKNDKKIEYSMLVNKINIDFENGKVDIERKQA